LNDWPSCKPILVACSLSYQSKADLYLSQCLCGFGVLLAENMAHIHCGCSLQSPTFSLFVVCRQNTEDYWHIYHTLSSDSAFFPLLAFGLSFVFLAMAAVERTYRSEAIPHGTSHVVLPIGSEISTLCDSFSLIVIHTLPPPPFAVQPCQTK